MTRSRFSQSSPLVLCMAFAIVLPSTGCQEMPELQKLDVITYGPQYEIAGLSKTPFLLGGVKVTATFVVEVTNNSDRSFGLSNLQFEFLSHFGDFEDNVRFAQPKLLAPGDKVRFCIRRTLRVTVATYHPTFKKLSEGGSLSSEDIALVGFLNVNRLSDLGKPEASGTKWVGEGYSHANIQNVRKVSSVDQLPPTDAWF
jgi:hypothetical protein